MTTADPTTATIERVISGPVVYGDQRGRMLGFPTANLRLPADESLRFGVYAGRLDGMPAAVSVGLRPTFGAADRPTLEAHVLDFAGDLYGRDVRVELLEFVRDEMAFSGTDALALQIGADVARVRERIAARDRTAAARVVAAAAALGRGEAIVLLGSGLGDGSSQLVVAADHADAGAINAMATDARGLISLALTASHCDRLGLALQHGRRHEPSGRPFTLSIEARHGVTTGISAEDRAVTIAAAIAADAGPASVVVPGHVFPLRARDGGTVERFGRPEAAIDLARLAGGTPAAVLCTLLDDDGEIAGRPGTLDHARERGLLTVAPADVLAHRRHLARHREASRA